MMKPQKYKNNSREKTHKRAVLTIEAALTVPMFLMAMVVLLCFANMYYVRERIDSVVCEEAGYAALISSDGNGIGYGVGGAEARTKDRLGRKFLEAGVIAGGAGGLDYSDTDLSNTEISVISIEYNYFLPFGIAAFDSVHCESKAIVHNWVGYINGLGSYSELSEYVYVTKNREVYHRSRECGHIRLHIRSINSSELKTLRNESGSKYKRCDYCRPKKSDAKLYVADDGDKYHNTLTCMGLKRTVMRVKLSEVGDLRPCSKCGY